MKRFSEQFKKQSESIRLGKAERRAVKERLLAYMEYHPLPTSLATPTLQPVARAASRWAEVKTVYVRLVAGVVAIAAIVAVPFAAENTLPGDVLYPVKVSFNEELRGSLTLSPYEKIEWETERLERRISEARLLANEGKLTDEVKAEVAEAVKEHSAAAQKEIAVIRETDSDEAAIAGITLSSALEVQSEVLESDLAKEGTASGTISAVAEAVEAARASVAAEQKDDAPSYDKLLARLESETTRAQEYLTSLTGVMSEKDKDNVNQRLEEIANKMTEAAELQAEDNEEGSAAARSLMTEALTDTRKLISYLTNIDVKETVSIETLLPMNLEDKELPTAVSDRLEAIANLSTEVTAALEATTSDVTAEASKRDQAMRLVHQATAAVNRGRFSSADSASAKALEILTQLKVELIDQPLIDAAATASTTATSSEATATSSQEAATSTDAE